MLPALAAHPFQRQLEALAASDRGQQLGQHRSLLGYDAARDDWAVTTDGEVIRRYPPEEMRLLVHWNAEVYADMDEVEKNMDHSADLTHDVVFERLLADLRSKGVDVAEPSDPMHDSEFIRALIAT